MVWQQGRIFAAVAVCSLLLCGSAIYRGRRGAKIPSVLETKGQGLGFRFQYGDWCDMLVNSGGWLGIPYVSCSEHSRSVATCGSGLDNNWQWSSEALSCGAHRHDPHDITGLLQGKWVVIAGDSIARYFYAALLRALANGDHQVVYGHQDFEYVLTGNIRATFLWAPYATNLSSLVDTWDKQGQNPDVVVLSAGLWHMLHISDVNDYLYCLESLRDTAQAFIKRLDEGQPLHLSHFLASVRFYPPKLKTEEKRPADDVSKPRPVQSSNSREYDIGAGWAFLSAGYAPSSPQDVDPYAHRMASIITMPRMTLLYKYGPTIYGCSQVLYKRS
eukprot:jgi/Botrbrau1/15309/Bobra.0319s0001.1